MPLSQRQLDDWFPTIVQYLGVVLTIILITATILWHFEYVSAYVAAAGMIGYREVARRGKNTRRRENGYGKEE